MTKKSVMKKPRTEKILNKREVFDQSGKVIPKFVSRKRLGFIPHGRYSVLRKNGRPLLEITYRHGVPHGPFVDFWSNGTLACEGQYHKAKQHGIWHFYWEDGSLMEIVEFKDGKEIPPFEVVRLNNGKKKAKLALRWHR